APALRRRWWSAPTRCCTAPSAWGGRATKSTKTRYRPPRPGRPGGNLTLRRERAGEEVLDHVVQVLLVGRAGHAVLGARVGHQLELGAARLQRGHQLRGVGEQHVVV